MQVRTQSRKDAKTPRDFPNHYALGCFAPSLLCGKAVLDIGVALCLSAPLPLTAAGPSKLTATSYGAAGQVSGSLHVLDTGNGRWMIDCGAVIDDDRGRFCDGQKGNDRPQKRCPPGWNRSTAVFLTHAHADHLGRLPLLVDRGFGGPIYMTEATAALAVPVLRVLLRCDRSTVRHWTWSKDRLAWAQRKQQAAVHPLARCKYCRANSRRKMSSMPRARRRN